MAIGEHPPIIGLAIEGWRYAFAALSRMPGLLGVAVLIMFALNVVTLPLLPDPQAEPTLGLQIMSSLINIVSGFLLTPGRHRHAPLRAARRNRATLLARRRPNRVSCGSSLSPSCISCSWACPAR